MWLYQDHHPHRFPHRGHLPLMVSGNSEVHLLQMRESASDGEQEVFHLYRQHNRSQVQMCNISLLRRRVRVESTPYLRVLQCPLRYLLPPLGKSKTGDMSSLD